MTKRIIIPGSRGFTNFPLMERMLDRLLLQYGDDIEIVSGHAEGADKLGEEYAKKHNIKCAVFPAQWEKHGRKAGPLRNTQMLEYAMKQEPVVVAFWDGQSRGTLDMLGKAQRNGVPATVIICENSRVLRIVKYSYDAATE